VLLPVAAGLYTYFGLTQETAAHFAMKNKRAAAYGVVCFIAFLGPALGAVAYFPADLGLAVAGGIKGVFVIPAICALIFMLITEPKRQKPWFKAITEREAEHSMQFRREMMVNPSKAARFGVMSGGVFLLSAAVFILLHFALEIPYAWLVFLFMFAAQAFLTSMIFEKKKD